MNTHQYQIPLPKKQKNKNHIKQKTTDKQKKEAKKRVKKCFLNLKELYQKYLMTEKCSVYSKFDVFVYENISKIEDIQDTLKIDDFERLTEYSKYELFKDKYPYEEVMDFVKKIRILCSIDLMEFHDTYLDYKYNKSGLSLYNGENND